MGILSLRNLSDSPEPSRNGSRWHVGFEPEESAILSAEAFRRLLTLERKRSERSRKHFLLVLLNAEQILPLEERNSVLEDVLTSLAGSTRETDALGWYRPASTVGAIFTELGAAEDQVNPSAILARLNKTLLKKLGRKDFDRIDISLHVYPDEWDHDEPGPPARLDLYPDLSEQKGLRKTALILKRAIDVLGSVLALVVLSPFVGVVALAIKLTSQGPVFFRQTRVGRYGKKFTLFKFRTMYVSNDPSIHKEYVTRLISGKLDASGTNSQKAQVFKIQADPRVTTVGRFLRRTSMDELPQFFNVFLGDMSLVGPRPPLPYECDIYEVWHRRRVLEAKPGITGLWQVMGRSRIGFDDMVRLDLEYARTWSLWLDLKILLHTPRAVFSGEGAY